jgi:hypothetical protein
MDQRRAEDHGGGPVDEQDGESAAELWERLAREMSSAREAAGIRPSDWGDTPDVPWTRSHLSNLEHGRGRPTPEIAALYDERCPHPSGPGRFAELQAAAAQAEQRARAPRRHRLSGVRARFEPAGPSRPSSGWRVRGGVLAAVLALTLMAAWVLFGGKDENAPSTGPRTVCARDVIVRHEPAKAVGDEHQLRFGEAFEVERYAQGPNGPYDYAGGVARGRDARGRGWVAAKYLCDPR